MDRTFQNTRHRSHMTSSR